MYRTNEHCATQQNHACSSRYLSWKWRRFAVFFLWFFSFSSLCLLRAIYFGETRTWIQYEILLLFCSTYGVEHWISIAHILAATERRFEGFSTSSITHAKLDSFYHSFCALKTTSRDGKDPRQARCVCHLHVAYVRRENPRNNFVEPIMLWEYFFFFHLQHFIIYLTQIRSIDGCRLFSRKNYNLYYGSIHV